MSLFSKIINSLVNFIDQEQQPPSSKVTSKEADTSSSENVDGFMQKIVEKLSAYLNSNEKDKKVLSLLLLFEHKKEKDSINYPQHLKYIAQQVKDQTGIDVAIDVQSATMEQWHNEEEYPKLLPTVALYIMDSSEVTTQNICASLIPLKGFEDKMIKCPELNTKMLTSTHQYFLVGREEHTKTRNGLPRRNDIAIKADVREVSRSHARIGYDKAQNTFYIKPDEGGENSGTRIVHNDSTEWYVLGSTRARLNLRDEDVIELGGENGVQLMFKLQN